MKRCDVRFFVCSASNRTQYTEKKLGKEKKIDENIKRSYNYIKGGKKMNTFLVDNYIFYILDFIFKIVNDYFIPILHVIALVYLIKYLKKKTE